MAEDVGEPLLVVRSLQKSFSQTSVLADVSLNIYPGDIFGIIGISGCGKTTLLRLLIGYLKPDSGEVLCHNGSSDASEDTTPSTSAAYSSLADCPEAIRRRFGFSAQQPSFYPELTVRENLEYFAALYTIASERIPDKVQRAIARLGLQHDTETLAANLSGGMQKRLDIAVALVHEPKILILDEPTADLDVFNRRAVWKLLKDINAEGTTIIIASHFLEEIETVCTSIAVLHGRKIIEQGSMDSLRHLLSSNQEVHLKLKSRNYNTIRAALTKLHVPVSSIREANGILVAQSPHADQLLQSILHLAEQYRDDVEDVSVQQPSLNEMFENMIGERPLWNNT